MVTAENLDVEILKKFGAKIPALANVNLNDPVAKQTVAQMINGNSEYRKYYNAAMQFLKQNSGSTNVRVLHEVRYTVTIWQNIILYQKRNGEIDRHNLNFQQLPSLPRAHLPHLYQALGFQFHFS